VTRSGREDEETLQNNNLHVRFIKKMQQDATTYQNFIIPYLYETQHVSGDTPPIIRSLKLHWKPLVFHTWKVVEHLDGVYWWIFA
jgi:hypothetical protein